MIRHIQFGPKETEELVQRWQSGACLRVIPQGTDDGTAVRYLVNMIQPAQMNANDEDCDEPINASHVCPPSCP